MIDKNKNDGINGRTLLGFDAACALVRDEVKCVLSDAPVIVKPYTRHLSGAQGKFIRATSLLACAMDDQDRIELHTVQFAAATEILHLATLVHDDIIDNAEVRRGIPSLQKKFGRRTAVICGDYLLSLALSTAAKVPYREQCRSFDLPGYVAQICYGELSQHINNGNLDLSVFEYLKIISGKTAALFESSFYVGASQSGCNADEIKQYKRLGWFTGMIFQLMDDCNDFESTQADAKKTVQSDYEQNVITLPLIHALNRMPALKARMQAQRIPREDLNEAVCASGGLTYTHDLARRYYKKALKIVDALSLTEEKRKRIMAVLNRAAQL